MFSLSKIGDLRASEREQEKKVTTNLAPYRQYHTAIPYRASIGPVQGFPCVAFPHREKNVHISGDPCNENRFFPVGNTTQEKPCSYCRALFSSSNKMILRVQCVSEFYIPQ